MKTALSMKQRNWLVGQMEIWLGQNLLEPEQAAGILANYESQEESSGRRRSILMTTLMSLAALMVGLAALLLIAHNWVEIPRGGKLTLIFAAIAGTYGAAFLANREGRSKRAVDAILLLASLFYGGGIFLVAQIFHMSAHYPNAILWWAIGVAPLAFCRRSLALDGLYAALLATWCGMEILGFRHDWWFFFDPAHGIPNGAYLLPLLALPGLLLAYGRQSPAAGALYVFLLSWWLVLQPFAWDLEFQIIYFIAAAGTLWLAVADSHQPGSAFAKTYRGVGMLLASQALIPLSYREVNRDIFKSIRTDAPVDERTAAFVLAVIIGTMIGLAFSPSLSRAIGKLSGWNGPQRHWLEILKRQAFTVSIAAALLVSMIWNLSLSEPILPTVLANLAMIALAINLIRTGLEEDRGAPFAAGVIYFLLWTILRYVDLFGDFGGMLGASGMFFVCGAILFFVGRYWQRRKLEAI